MGLSVQIVRVCKDVTRSKHTDIRVFMMVRVLALVPRTQQSIYMYSILYLP